MSTKNARESKHDQGASLFFALEDLIGKPKAKLLENYIIKCERDNIEETAWFYARLKKYIKMYISIRLAGANDGGVEIYAYDDFSSERLLRKNNNEIVDDLEYFHDSCPDLPERLESLAKKLRQASKQSSQP